MWAEAQVDKSRPKEENPTKLDIPLLMGSKIETHVSSAVESNQSPLPVVDAANNEASPCTAENQKPFSGLQISRDHLNSSVQDFSMGSDNLFMQQQGYASKRSRSLLKSYIAHRAEEMYVYRSLPLGQDRRCNRYWQFVASASRNDPGCGRIFVELHDGHWRLIDSEEGFDALLTSLDARGVRESHLRLMLQKIEMSFKQNVRKIAKSSCIVGNPGSSGVNEATEMDISPDHPVDFDSPQSMVCGIDSDTLEALSSFRIELGRNEIEKKAALKRYQDFQRWMWKECFNSSVLRAMKYEKKRCTQLLSICDFCLNSHLFEDAHCLSCHQTFSQSSDFSQHVIHCEEKRNSDFTAVNTVDSSLPVRVRLLKALLSFIEVSAPSEVVQTFWTENHRKSWGMKLNASSSTEELLQVLTLFESVIRRESLSSSFETTKELLGSSNLSCGATLDVTDPESVSVLPWIPRTTAAVALRLLELDSSIAYVQFEKADTVGDKEVKEHKLPSTYAPENNNEVEPVELQHDHEYIKQKGYSDLDGGRNSYKRGRGGREQGRGKKWLKRVSGSRSVAYRQNAGYNENISQGIKQQDQRTVGYGRGRRTVRRRRAEKRAVDGTFLGHNVATVSPKSSGESPRNMDDEWVNEQIGLSHMEGADNGNSAAPVESDENVFVTRHDDERNWEQDLDDDPNRRWSGHLMEMSDEDVDASEDEDEDSEDMSEEGSGGGEGNVVMRNEGTESAVSEDYSD